MTGKWRNSWTVQTTRQDQATSRSALTACLSAWGLVAGSSDFSRLVMLSVIFQFCLIQRPVIELLCRRCQTSVRIRLLLAKSNIIPLSRFHRLYGHKSHEPLMWQRITRLQEWTGIPIEPKKVAVQLLAECLKYV